MYKYFKQCVCVCLKQETNDALAKKKKRKKKKSAKKKHHGKQSSDEL